jgi:acyl carrier protein
MTRDEIVRQVNDLMRKGFEISSEKLVPEANLKSGLGLDSLDTIDMLVYLEERFGTKISGERLSKVRTLGDVYDLVESVAASAKTKND